MTQLAYGPSMSFAAGTYRSKRSALDVPFVPTPQDVLRLMLDVANPQPEERLYDLGCGDGRILRRAVREYGCIGVGYEIDPSLASYAASKARREGLKPERQRVVCRDLSQANLGRADVVTLYLTPEALLGLRRALEAQLRPEARVISHDYRIRGWMPESVQETVSALDGKKHTVFLYRAPVTSRRGQRR